MIVLVISDEGVRERNEMSVCMSHMSDGVWGSSMRGFVKKVRDRNDYMYVSHEW